MTLLDLSVTPNLSILASFGRVAMGGVMYL